MCFLFIVRYAFTDNNLTSLGCPKTTPRFIPARWGMLLSSMPLEVEDLSADQAAAQRDEFLDKYAAIALARAPASAPAPPEATAHPFPGASTPTRLHQEYILASSDEDSTSDDSITKTFEEYGGIYVAILQG